MKFSDMVAQISQVDGAARVTAGQTLQQILSVRNWWIGATIVEFEQGGEDRAAYGERLITRLAHALVEVGCSALSSRNLKNFRQVALAYPGLDVADLGRRLALDRREGIRQTSAESSPLPFPSLARRALDPQLPWRDATWLAQLFTGLTFSHLLELSRIDDEPRRAFYELHCLKERWSVREMQRQRDSMLYERVGLSKNRDEVLALARQGLLSDAPAAQLRDPYPNEADRNLAALATLARTLCAAAGTPIDPALRVDGRVFLDEAPRLHAAFAAIPGLDPGTTW